MKIKKILNNNAVVALDKLNQEVIVMGKGIAYQHKVGDGIDEHLIDKVCPLFSHEVFMRFQELLTEIPVEYFKIASEIAEDAKILLGKKLNDSLYLSLSDHIFSAVNRQQEGIYIKNALLWDIRRFYSNEFKVGLKALTRIKHQFDVQFPEDEAGFIALHIVGSEGTAENQDVYLVTKIIQEISNIVKYYFKISFDEESVYFYRFISHLKFFAQRVMSGAMHADDTDDSLLALIKVKYHSAFSCVEKISIHIENNYNHILTNEEKLYLTVHIHRVIYKNVI